MGRNYKFILITDKENKKNIESYINAHSEKKYNLDVDDTLRLTFPRDSALSAYLHEMYPDPAERKLFIKDGPKVLIEFIMFHQSVLENTDIVRYEFSAPTNRMSDLFYASSSVEDWFIEMGKASNALVVYFDIEFSDSIIYSDPEKINIYFEDDYYVHLDHNQFCETIINAEIVH